MNKQIDKKIIKAEDDNAAIINSAIKLEDDERSARNKTTIHQRAQLGKEYITATHNYNYISTREGKHVQFNITPSIITYQQHDNKPMVTYNSGADGH